MRDVNINIEKGQLVGIIGETGSGKSSLVQAILGEMKSRGVEEMMVSGTVSYVPQKSWNIEGSVRDNVQQPG